MNTLPQSAWDVEAQEEVDAHGVSLWVARDAVIFRWLLDGDVRPFYAWTLQAGHPASKNVINLLALMLAKADDPTFPATVPFGLAVERTGAGRPIDKEREVLNRIAGKFASRQMDAGAKGIAADLDAQSFLAANGAHVSLGSVEAARKKVRRDRRGK